MAAPKRIPTTTLSTVLTRPTPRRLAHPQQQPGHQHRPRHLSSSPSHASPSKYYPPPSKTRPKPASLAEPSLPAISYLPPPSNDPHQRALPAPVPHATSLTQASTIFTSQPPRFLYSAARFLALPFNTHTPEVCLIGRSNVGKSTLINALAGADANTARKAHGLQARGAGLAITSRFAGSTKSVNAYGFGPPSKAQRLAALARAKEVKEAMGTPGSRGERRAARDKREAPPVYRLIMVDMPGYGLGSEAAWGKEIEKYLARREMLKGAVLLIDAVAGIKEADRMVLETLRDAEVRTAVVLTKVDKLSRESQAERAQSRVEEVCLSVWEELRRVERGSMTWMEGSEKGWQNEIWVTSAGDADSDGNGVGVVGARWAICQMAGLVEDARALKMAQARPAVQKIVSFDDIQRAAASMERISRMRPAGASF
ncbi:P-loop containing nucleoside triphosphate hydrolase protein [Parachaetomium inaequale]|uniref:P-loop containing nucleoside triphosphate hydrolase protein n=1 Tax=Parachaetomium inaequale TaxID=2588326 RepID=A0AAN6SPF2_9PEZI|nr:P-loop containing nucleoside triphosphate hydrolase protein [Parachaetomium inaequale]